MRTTIVVLALFLFAREARGASGWEGFWKTSRGEPRTLARERGLLALSVKLDVDPRAFHLVGAPNGDRLHLEGRLEGTRGIEGALAGEKAAARSHALVLDAELEAGGSRATVKVKLDGAERATETWTRGTLELVSLEEGGAPLAGVFDAKRSKTGLVVRYRVHAGALRVAVHVRPASGHRYASFYTKDVIATDLGTVEPGERTFTWDGRDDTEARRIALGGPYEVSLEADGDKAGASFTVAAPCFEALCSEWPRMEIEDTEGETAIRLEWKPKNGLDLVSALLAVSLDGAASPGFSCGGARVVTSPEQVRERAVTAASLLIATHGDTGLLWLHDGKKPVSYVPSQLFQRDLKDVHFAFVSACLSGHGGEKSVVHQLVASGCDVAIGFDASIDIPEAADFETVAIALMARGDPIKKAALDAGTALTTVSYARGTAPPIRGDAVIIVEAARGIDADTESLWPPRYGRSTN